GEEFELDDGIFRWFQGDAEGGTAGFAQYLMALRFRLLRVSANLQGDLAARSARSPNRRSSTRAGSSKRAAKND
ncbi:MAG: hypothetical protein ACOYMN_05465, partial [Roseimicrobium sp.]